jgi:putative transposase
MQTVQALGPRLGVAPTCRALGLPPATYYRQQQPRAAAPARTPPPRALAPAERQAVLDVLHGERFVDVAPAEVVATLLDEGRYLCAERTMYRLLAAHQEVRERRHQRRHPSYAAPELLATAPNQLWSWDITKLKGPAKWVYYYLYVILDVFSRYVVGWMVASRESATLAERLIAASCARQGITPGQLTLHADRGAAMRSQTVALLLADLGVTKTHSRPYTATDNPYSEALFKTAKYRPEIPERFGCLEHARQLFAPLFDWYNTEHRHSGLAMLTPQDVHAGLAAQRLADRAAVLAAAYAAHPERFPGGVPTPGKPPAAVWINKPVGGGCAEKTVLLECPRSDDREAPRAGVPPPLRGSGRLRRRSCWWLLSKLRTECVSFMLTGSARLV